MWKSKPTNCDPLSEPGSALNVGLGMTEVSVTTFPLWTLDEITVIIIVGTVLTDTASVVIVIDNGVAGIAVEVIGDSVCVIVVGSDELAGAWLGETVTVEMECGSEVETTDVMERDVEGKSDEEVWEGEGMDDEGNIDVVLDDVEAAGLVWEGLLGRRNAYIRSRD
jgi:hypothetical protein